MPCHRGGLGQSSTLTQALAAVGSSTVRDARFRSQVSPEIPLGDPFRPTPRTAAEGGVNEAFLRFAKPAVYFQLAGRPMVIAPWGQPQTNYFPLLLGAAVIGGALGIGLVARGLLR